jgi:lactoylglutathione lyase
MTLNHLNLTVGNVLETHAFLEKYFGLRALGKGNDNMALLSDDTGMVINILKGTEVSYPETFHIGFIQESEERVNEVYQCLKEDGFQIDPPRKFHGSWTFYFQSPGGFLVEVLC